MYSWVAEMKCQELHPTWTIRMHTVGAPPREVSPSMRKTMSRPGPLRPLYLPSVRQIAAATADELQAGTTNCKLRLPDFMSRPLDC